MKKTILNFIVLIILLIAMIIFSAITGSIKITPYELIQGLINKENYNVDVIKDLRFPRLIIALLAGAALAVSGVLFQSVLRNPLAEPGIIGVSSGASFMTILMVSLFPTLYFYGPLFAFLGGAIAFILVYSFSWKSGLDPLRMILIGVAINAVFTSLSQTFNYRGSYTSSVVQEVTTSTLGMRKWADVDIILIYGSIGLILAYLVYSWCNYLVLEDKTARNLGMNVNIARFIVSIIAVLLASIATATAGMFAFVGLLIPHIARRIIGTNHKFLIPYSALLGALFILSADTIGRLIIAPNEIPASIIVALFGGPFLIFILRKGDQVYGR